MSAIWYWAQALGQPFRLIRIEPSRSPIRRSRCSISSAARCLVSTIASLQNSMPVQEMMPRRKADASVGKAKVGQLGGHRLDVAVGHVDAR